MTTPMKLLIALEEFAKLIATYLASLWFGYDWWVFFALLLLPDLSMIGYVINTRVGAVLYNLAHHQAVAVAVFVVGYVVGPDWLIISGLVLFGHSAMDRMLGYGLKYPDAFKHTHLGWIGAAHPDEK